MASLFLGYSEKPADFTIAIAVQDGDRVVYPGNETGWNVYQGRTVQIVNTTGEDVRVKVTPDVYQGASPFTVAAFSRTTCTVKLIHPDDLAGIEIKHTFEFPTEFPTENLEEQPRVVTGGPKMVPTEPEEL